MAIAQAPPPPWTLRHYRLSWAGDRAMKKKALSIGVRVTVATVGLAYVVYALNWTDHVRLPAGYTVGAITLAEPMRYPVIAKSAEQWTLEIDTQRLAIPANVRELIEAGGAFEPGVLTTLRSADGQYLLLAMLIIAGIMIFQPLRWRLLMRCRGLPAPPWPTFRIYMVGQFFNSFMPGMTGGDVMKAYYVARRSDRRAAAVMSVVADRIIGLIALVILGVIGSLVAWTQGAVSQRELMATAVVAGGVIVVGVLYFSKPLQRGLGLAWMLSLLPSEGLIASVRQAASAYRDHKLPLVQAATLGVIVHLFIVTSAIVTGWALGLDTPTPKLLALLPLVLMAGALPLSFMGVGVIEPTGMALLGDGTAATDNQIVVMLVLIRLYQIAYSLVGALFLMRGNLDLPESQAAEPAA